MKNDFKDILNEIMQELALYKDIPPEELLTDCIRRKLQSTVLKYNKTLDMSSNYLTTRACEKVLKALTKIRKKDDKKALSGAQTEEKEKND